MTMNFGELHDACLYLAFEKQNRLSQLVDDHEWKLDVAGAKVTFNEEFVFDAHFLGSESEQTGTWLWADANEQLECPPQSLDLCKKVRAQGREKGIECFQLDTFKVEDGTLVNGHSVAMTATHLGNASCYYSAPSENGSLFFAMIDPRIDAQPDLGYNELQDAIETFVCFPGDPKMQVLSYLTAKGMVEKGFEGDEVQCRLSDGTKVGFSFLTDNDGGMEVRIY